MVALNTQTEKMQLWTPNWKHGFERRTKKDEGFECRNKEEMVALNANLEVQFWTP